MSARHGRKTSDTTRRPAEAVAWLQENPSLHELAAEYPGEWEPVQRQSARSSSATRPTS